MPKIRKLDVKIDRQRLELQIYYNQKNLFHLKGLPLKWTQTVDFFNRQETESKLLDSFYVANKQYHKKVSTETKVIQIRFAVGHSQRMKRTAIGRWDGVREYNNIPDISYEHGLGFTYSIMSKIVSDKIEYAEIWNGEKSRYRKEPEFQKNPPIEIPYSEEAEQFLRMVGKQCNAMSDKFKEFFQSEELELKIKSNVKLLPNIK